MIDFHLNFGRIAGQILVGLVEIPLVPPLFLGQGFQLLLEELVALEEPLLNRLYQSSNSVSLLKSQISNLNLRLNFPLDLGESPNESIVALNKDTLLRFDWLEFLPGTFVPADENIELDPELIQPVLKDLDFLDLLPVNLMGFIDPADLLSLS